MRTIIKSDEPAGLKQHRSGPHADYENYPDKDTLRTYLVKEQRGLCCYCLARIRAKAGGMKIEHWHSQHRHPAEQLDYSNLLGACVGNEGARARDQHCDTRKGDRDLSRNPANRMDKVEEAIRYLGDGQVFSDDKTFDKELNEILNLNLPFLKNNRKAVLTAFKDALPKSGELRPEKLERWLLDWNGESGTGQLQPHCQVIVYWLRKKLARP